MYMRYRNFLIIIIIIIIIINLPSDVYFLLTYDCI
jgi:hypothetical protein